MEKQPLSDHSQILHVLSKKVSKGQLSLEDYEMVAKYVLGKGIDKTVIDLLDYSELDRLLKMVQFRDAVQKDESLRAYVRERMMRRRNDSFDEADRKRRIRENVSQNFRT